ncbi:MAG: PD-(D/E)XK nuclease family protein [Elainellaceae cyanobacterium]
MSKAKIVLPKKNEEGKSYISYSQYNKWKSDKKDYIKSYFLGERFEGNAYTDFGSLIGEALENNDFSGFTPEEVKLLSKVTRLDQFEREIVWDFGDFFVKGFIDTNDSLLDSIKPDAKEVVTKIVDYKTGASNKVSVYEADDYDQVAIYAGAIEQETGHLPTKGWVELIERTGNPFKGEELKLGKKVFTIPQDVSKKKIEETRAKVLKVAKEISAAYKVFNILNSIEV